MWLGVKAEVLGEYVDGTGQDEIDEAPPSRGVERYDDAMVTGGRISK